MKTPRVRIRPDIAQVTPYRQGRMAAEDAFKLSSNENPYDPLPSVARAMATAEINRYPEGSAAIVRDRLGAKWGVNPERVIVGPGSVALIANIITMACTPGDEVLYAWRSFEAYPLLAGAIGARSVMVPLRPDGTHDIDAMIAAVTDRTRVVFLCSPNNPTGPIITREEFDRFMRGVPATLLVVLDEAYAEFVTDPRAVRGEDVVNAYPNLVVLRTFSKAYGLAGLRIGYAIGPEYVIDAIRVVAMPLAVTDFAQRAAVASLDDEPELLERVAEIARRRDDLRAGLIAQGWDVPDAQGNFVWLPTGPYTLEAAEAFEQAGLIVRALGEGIRISVGEAESVEKLLRSAEEVVAVLRSRGHFAG